MDNPVVVFLEERYAGRAIDRFPIPEEVLEELADAIRWTPSCMNNQPWRYLFILSEEGREKMKACWSRGNLPWASRAPLQVIGYSTVEDDCVNPDGRQYHQFDLGLATMNLMLAATARRLVARPMAGFDPAKVKETFNLPENAQPLVAVAIGYPSDDDSHVPEYARGKDKKPRERKPVSETITRL